jgi:hypothetical protein
VLSHCLIKGLYAASILLSTHEALPDRALRTASALMAHNLCSARFISGLDPKATADELVKPMLPGFVGPLLRYHVDPALKTVDARPRKWPLTTRVSTRR